MAASYAQDGPRWRQDGHLGLNFGGFGAILGVTWTSLGGLGEDLGGIERLWEVLGALEGFAGFARFCKALGVLGRLWYALEGFGKLWKGL